MTTKSFPSDLPVHSFETAAEFESFLYREHSTASGLHLKIAKKSSGIQSITAAEAVETALCFGWIDGQANKFDEDWFLVRYTPRRPKSLWSRKNVETAGKLIEKGRVRSAGMAAIEAAQADGRWECAYAGPATMTVPNDFAIALASDPKANEAFEHLNRTDRYSILWRLETGATKIRLKRITSLMQSLRDNKTSSPSRKANGTSNKVEKRRIESSVNPKRSVSRTNSRSSLCKDQWSAKHSGRPGLRSQNLPQQA